MKKLFVFISILLYPFAAFSSPVLLSDPCPGAIGAKYSVYEITPAFPEGRLAYSDPAEADGSIKLDLNAVPIGTHQWKIRYEQGDAAGDYSGCILVVSVLDYKSAVKTFNYYAFTKSWVLKVYNTEK